MSSAAAIFSTGTFTQDDQQQTFSLIVPSAATVTIQTFGYGGGTASGGQVVNAGGFDPILSLFNSAGLLIGLNDNGTCGPLTADPLTGNCFDSRLSLGLSAGTYTLVLTQFDNFPFGPAFTDGFSQTGQGNFTCANFMGTSGPFCDQTPSQRTGNWALEINVPTSTTTIPEPASFALVSAGLLTIIRRYKHQ